MDFYYLLLQITSDESIIVDDNSDSPEPEESSNWIKNFLFTLTKNDRSVILSPVAWLNDNIIAAAQELLKKQFNLSGLQPPSLGLTCAFEIESGEFIQILHDGFGHWLTVSTIGAGENEVLGYARVEYCTR